MLKRNIVLAVLVSVACGCQSRCSDEPSVAKAFVRTKSASGHWLRGAVDDKAAGEIRNVLVLSGGGAFGAYGAGFLAGWANNPVSPRPKFEVVTGISTGALQATAAFLGEDCLLQQAYMVNGDRDVFAWRPFLLIPFSNSVFTTEPLADRIRRYLSNDVIDRVASEGRRGRVLCVATCNADSGQLQIWNLTNLAQKPDSERYDKYRQIVLAAASVPILFPPVFIEDENGNSEMHVDAGVRTSVFLRESVLALADRKESVKALGAQPPQATVHVLINGTFERWEPCVEDLLVPILFRSLEIMMASGTMGELRRVKEIAERAGMKFVMTSIRDSYSPGFGEHQFDGKKMQLLFEEGKRAGMAGEWRTEIPDLEPPVRASPSRMLRSERTGGK